MALDCDSPILEALYHSQTLSKKDAITFTRSTLNSLLEAQGFVPCYDGLRWTTNLYCWKGLRGKIYFDESTHLNLWTLDVVDKATGLAWECVSIAPDSDQFFTQCQPYWPRMHLTKANVRKCLLAHIEWALQKLN